MPSNTCNNVHQMCTKCYITQTGSVRLSDQPITYDDKSGFYLCKKHSDRSS